MNSACATSIAQASGQGSYSNGSLSMSTFSLVGLSAGGYDYTESGSAGTWGFNHSDHLLETYALDFQASAPGDANASTAWSFSDYTSTFTKYERLNDNVGGQHAQATLSDQRIVRGSGSGSMGTQTETATGSYVWNDRSYEFTYPPTDSTQTLTGPSLTSFNAEAVPANFQPAVTTMSWAAPAVQQVATARALVGGRPGAANVVARVQGAPPASDLPLVVPIDNGGGQVPPVLAGLNADLGASHSYPDGLYFGGWFAPPGGRSPPLPPLKWLGQFHERLGTLANRASQDAWNKTQQGGGNVLAMNATVAWQAEVDRLGANVTGDWLASLGEAYDYAAGVVNNLTGNILRSRAFLSYLDTVWGLGGLIPVGQMLGQYMAYRVDYNSAAYHNGERAGEAIGLVAGDLLGLEGIRLAASLFHAMDAIEEGDELLSRHEHNPFGPLTYKRVVAVFTRVSPIWRLVVRGQHIDTTPEHPFFVLGGGLVLALELQAGDVLFGENGSWSR